MGEEREKSTNLAQHLPRCTVNFSLATDFCYSSNSCAEFSCQSCRISCVLPLIKCKQRCWLRSSSKGSGRKMCDCVRSLICHASIKDANNLMLHKFWLNIFVNPNYNMFSSELVGFSSMLNCTISLLLIHSFTARLHKYLKAATSPVCTSCRSLTGYKQSNLRLPARLLQLIN